MTSLLNGLNEKHRVLRRREWHELYMWTVLRAWRPERYGDPLVALPVVVATTTNREAAMAVVRLFASDTTFIREPDLPPRRTLVRKVLTFEVFERDPMTNKAGPVLATVKGWDALDEFLKARGTALVRMTGSSGIGVIQTPQGWDVAIVGMENHYDDGTVEGR